MSLAILSLLLSDSLFAVPPGDEIWLCPGCKCKVHCIDLLNGVQGTRLSIQDNWEVSCKIFSLSHIS